MGYSLLAGFSLQKENSVPKKPSPQDLSQQDPVARWNAAQEYELKHATKFMKKEFFSGLIEQFKRGELHSSTGWVSEIFLKEFFDNDKSAWEAFLASVQGKVCLDVGPSVFSPLATWDGVGEAIAIEPLGDKIVALQKELFGCSAFDGMTLKAVGADVLLPELEGRVDGAIYCRNMLDHTPEWPVVLDNLGRYAAPGCRLLLWTDVDHRGKEDAGHFNICKDASLFKTLVERRGFSVLREFCDQGRAAVNWGCTAVKV